MSDTPTLFSELSRDPLQFVPFITAMGLVIGVRYWLRKKYFSRTQKKANQGEETPYRLKEIYIYPIKSCYRIQLSTQTVGKYGFVNDRKWMIVQENGRFLTQRQEPRMTLIKPSFEGDYMVLNGPDGIESIRIPLHAPERREGPLIDVGVWNDDLKAVDEGDQVAAWIQRVLGREGVRLVRQRDDCDRKVPKKFTEGDRDNLVSFADGFPFLLVSEGAIQQLNEKISESSDEKNELPITRFRPNLVIEGPPFIEDTWKKIKIGDVVFRIVKHCPRCKLTTVDPEKGVFTGKEPLQTLATFRSGLLEGGKEVCFGQNLINDNLGKVSLGDTVTVLE